MREWIRALSTSKAIRISLILGFLFTASQGVGVSGWLYDVTDGLGMVWVGVLINLVRNVLLAAVVIFIVLRLAQRWSQSQVEPSN